MRLLVPEEVILACKTACNVRAPKVITEKSMLGGPVYPLMSSQIFRCDESFATDGADLSPGAMPASVVALKGVSRLCLFRSFGREASNLLFLGL